MVKNKWTASSVKEKLVNFYGRFITPHAVCIQKAVRACHDSGLHASGQPNLSFRASGKSYSVSYEVVRKCYQGTPSHWDAAAGQQQLSPAVEKVVKEYMDERAARGIPTTQQDVMEAASIISGIQCGEAWYCSFWDCTPTIVTKVAWPLDAPWAQALSQANVLAFFNMLKNLVEEHSEGQNCSSV
jgi:hypothetical protein